uniref:Uncharacterized protein n=1 Tax=Neobodo designis TaxID=312471 RepID=A0A7S1KYG7_NEODS|eukprot:CAMPEP_0174843546 /NCGR_PEP_ID=MMETSP1114-20130205/10589_1 /TAXON_ID=312471 /ORGANISM="Neobodo designis, Strain CCAP 1951/1" /LENGTH=502 /DNA_ID=CAMNT_0016077771 /DNA_START=31 /DNA_END=1539 /DNA_ORIENTATION=+
MGASHSSTDDEVRSDLDAASIMERTGSDVFTHTDPSAADGEVGTPTAAPAVMTAGEKDKKPTACYSFRLLTLEGQTGAVFCRVHDPRAQRTLPSLSDAGRVEFATRSLLRMLNLAVFRGRDRRGSMVGPGDYYCNVERPHERAFTIAFDPTTRVPAFVPHSIDDVAAAPDRELRPVRTGEDTAVVPAAWISGKTDPDAVAARAEAFKRSRRGDGKIGGDLFGGSLFPDPGILEVDVGVANPGDDAACIVTLPAVDATAIDLAPFKARLVRNDAPFRIVETKLDAKDEFRPVSYDFGERYAAHCVAPGAGGLFLETHEFTQTMTPLDAFARGFITLGRWLDDANHNGPTKDPSRRQHRRLELIAVRIPFGWTILVDRGCMHGDSTFIGNYMMSMTSNHVTMQTADTVFLKAVREGSAAFRNVELRCDAHRAIPHDAVSVPRSPRPIVCFSEPTDEELAAFKRETAGMSFMLQPFSKLSWATTLYRRFNWFPSARSASPQSLGE